MDTHTKVAAPCRETREEARGNVLAMNIKGCLGHLEAVYIDTCDCQHWGKHFISTGQSSLESFTNDDLKKQSTISQFIHL